LGYSDEVPAALGLTIMQASNKNILITLAAVLILSGVSLQAQTRVKLDKGDTSAIPLYAIEDLRPGMKGVARTVFSGTEPEPFELEILGVLDGFTGPRQSTIIARLSGTNVARTGVFAGMSGSPVFIDNKLVGAIAYSFPFAKEPICGITPIKQMIDIFERVKEKPRTGEARVVSFSSLASTDWKASLPKQPVSATTLVAPVATNSPLAPLMGQQIQPIATPVVFSGISQDALSMFSSQLSSSGLLPVSGVGGAGKITPLESFDDKTLAPGTSVSVALARGDYSVAAAGTVTFRDGEKIYAFGHPFLSIGSADMPMAESSVVTVIPNAFNSFKLSVPGRMVGAISQDRATGIFGQLGHESRMIPVKLNLHTSRGQDEQFNYEVVSDEFLTPLLLNLTIYNSIAARERSIGEATITIDGAINIDGQSPIAVQRRFSTVNAALMAAGSIAGPTQVLLSSGFDNIKIKSVTLDVTSTEEKNSATLERISLDRTEVERGDKLELQAYVRTDSGKQFIEKIPLQIPADAPSGPLTIMIGDGAALQESSAAKSFVPRELKQLVDAINKTKKNDRLYLKLLRPAAGVVIGSNELPNLPPSVVATLNSERTSGGYTALTLSPLFEKELPPADFVINGQQTISVIVK
jgi:SpoIVB peptidase S55